MFHRLLFSVFALAWVGHGACAFPPPPKEAAKPDYDKLAKEAHSPRIPCETRQK
jgi:hypothetical protein